MQFDHVKKQFSKMGARVKIVSVPVTTVRGRSAPLVADVKNDRQGEYFELRVSPAVKAVDVLNLDAPGRHLVLGSREDGTRGEVKRSLLMGHDERHWFVAETRGNTVWEAKESLKPAQVAQEQKAKGVRQKNWHKRHNKAYKRQGEWFFVPEPDFEPNPKLIMKHEPLQRNFRSKPHTVEELYRAIGRIVMVCSKYPNGISMKKYNEMRRECHPDIKAFMWVDRTIATTVYVRGKVSHADHKTLKLDCWHRVVMNSESTSNAVAFLD